MTLDRALELAEAALYEQAHRLDSHGIVAKDAHEALDEIAKLRENQPKAWERHGDYDG